jgi:hypothetical protein
MSSFFNEPIVKAAGVLAMGPILAAMIGGYAFYNARMADDVITVTGSARETVQSDRAKITISVSVRTGTYDQASGYQALTRGVADVTGKLRAAAFTDIDTMPQSIFEQYGEKSEVVGYTLSQDIVVSSEDVSKVKAFSNTIEALQGNGYMTRLSSVEYTYTKLDEMRVKLLGAAVADAKARADAITSESGRTTGSLKSAASGVVQVLPKHGVDISDYGSYDTQSIEKDVMVTTRAVFGIR